MMWLSSRQFTMHTQVGWSNYLDGNNVPKYSHQHQAQFARALWAAIVVHGPLLYLGHFFFSDALTELKKRLESGFIEDMKWHRTV